MYNKVLETGELVVTNKVKITVDIETIKKSFMLTIFFLSDYF